MLRGLSPAIIGSFISTSIFFSIQEANFKQRINLLGKKGTKSNDKEAIKFRVFKDFTISFILADIVKCTVLIPFESIKQRMQLTQNIKSVNSIFFYSMLKAYPYILLRELIVRITSISGFLFIIDPKVRILHSKEKINGKIKDKFDCIMYDNKSLSFKAFILFGSVFTSTLITNPFDVIITKYLTQTDYSYTTIRSIIRVINHEGYRKLLSGFTPRLSYNIIISFNFLYLYSYLLYKVNQFERNTNN